MIPNSLPKQVSENTARLNELKDIKNLKIYQHNIVLNLVDGDGDDGKVYITLINKIETQIIGDLMLLQSIADTGIKSCSGYYQGIPDLIYGIEAGESVSKPFRVYLTGQSIEVEAPLIITSGHLYTDGMSDTVTEIKGSLL